MLALLADLSDIAGARAFDTKERTRIFLPVGLVKFQNFKQLEVYLRRVQLAQQIVLRAKIAQILGRNALIYAPLKLLK